MASLLRQVVMRPCGETLDSQIVDRRLMPVSALSYLSSNPVYPSLCNKVCGMYYPVCETVRVKNILLPNEKSNKYSPRCVGILMDASNQHNGG